MEVNFFKKAFNITQPDIERYAEDHSTDEDALLYDVNRQTHLNTLTPRMLSGKLQGQFLSFISQIKQSRYILEIGTFTGYSALCLIKGLAPNGELHTIEVNPELRPKIELSFARHPRVADIKLHIGNAIDIMPQLDRKWDLVFIDAQKTEYLNYYEIIKPQMNQGGVIIFDNVLWGGKVLGKESEVDQKTATLIKLNKHLQEDQDIENILIPMRDGLMMVYMK